MKKFDFDKEEQVPSNKVIPNIHKSLIQQVLQAYNIYLDLQKAIKKHSLSLEPNAGRVRFEKTQAIANELAQTIFPIFVNGIQVKLQAQPTILSRQEGLIKTLHLKTLPEPSVEFNSRKESSDIRDGITRFGAFEYSPKKLEIVPICTDNLRANMASLIERLKLGKYKYKGSERTFSTRLKYNTIITIPSDEMALEECQRLLRENPDWVGNENLDRLF
ncbi:MAG: hypothetical protein HC773_17035 [Scytonema sp. CRU_2_7]|nr:hypothetical protein [Scytonema sp. CRU_2_7]